MTPDLSSFLSGLINHLWQSTLFAGIVAALVLTMRRHSAGLRHAMWCVASAKFLVPFSLLTAIGSAVDWPSATRSMPLPMPQLGAVAFPVVAEPQTEQSIALVAAVLTTVWIAGFTCVVLRWVRAWKRARIAVRSARPADRVPTSLKHVLDWADVRFSLDVATPAVFGLFRHALLLPADIEGRLGPEELSALVAHERAHVRRRDNLTGGIHSLVTAVFWFHPLVWWMGRQLIRERECACDEAALREGFEPDVYARGLVEVCRSVLAGSLTAPVACAAGGHGSDLKRRMEGIMNFRSVRRPGPVMKLTIGTFLVAAVLVPVAIGLGRSAPDPVLTFQEPEARQQQDEYLSHWLQEDAAAIITDEERQAFEALTTDEERYQFIEQFWLRRDPSAGTVGNELQEEEVTDPAPEPVLEEPQTPEQPRQQRQNEYLSNWLQEDARSIITEEEQQAFDDLRTDEERYQFIEQFWLRRDPTPGTVQNEFQEEHYRRIAYANQHFASGISGSETDRGRIYLTWGPPDEIESSTAREVWRYRYIEGLGQDVEFEFADPAGSNEFRLVNPPQ